MLNSNDQWVSLLNEIKKTFHKYNVVHELSYVGFSIN